MRQLKEALIGRHNVSKAHINSVTKVLEKFTKKDLATGDMVILKDKSIGIFISGKDLKDSDDLFGQQYKCKNGAFVFPDWHIKDRFEFCDINDYMNDLKTTSSFDELTVKYIIKNIFDPNLRRNKSKCWEFMSDISNYDEILPENVLEFIELS